MKGVELYGRVRYAVQIEGLSHRETARRFGLDPRTVAKMVRFSVPPGYVRKKPPAKPKLDPFIAVIDRILGDDKSRPKKQQHTAKRVFERLRDEYGFTGGITIVKDYVAGWRQRTQEMFVPLGGAEMPVMQERVVRATRSRVEADHGARDHALRLGASGR
jgi:transposase